jgi:signal transduction histidine kinase
LQIGVNLWLGRDADRLNDQRAWHGAELWHIGYRRLDLGDEGLWLGVYLPVSELIPGLRYQLLILASVLVLALAITLYLAIGVARKFSLPLEDLADNSRRIGDLDFTAPPSVHSPLREVEQLARTQEQMRHLLADAHQDLYRKNRQLQDTQERLIQAAKLESVGRLAAGVAHEVKNPLAIVQMGIDYFQQEPLSEDAREVLVDMDDAVGRADGVVKGLLDFSRERRLNLESGDINEVIRSSEHLVEHEFKQHDIQLIQQLSEELPRFALDADKLRQVFINLFINAIQAMGQKGVLTVSSGLRTLNEYGGLDWRRYATLRNGEQVIYVEVRDTGPGISEDQRARIFDPFFTTKAVGQGTGLGLSVSRNIIELHGGHIDIRNHDGGGASVQLLFKLDKGSGHDTQNPRR